MYFSVKRNIIKGTYSNPRHKYHAISMVVAYPKVEYGP